MESSPQERKAPEVKKAQKIDISRFKITARRLGRLVTMAIRRRKDRLKDKIREERERKLAKKLGRIQNELRTK